MSQIKEKIFGSLYWKISAIFLLLLIILGIAYIYITARSAENYALETNQKLNADLANVISSEFKPFVGETIDQQAIVEIMHHIMKINPSLEVYLLDDNGKILSYAAPHKKVKLKSVSLEPIKKFISNKGNVFIKGDDPRQPGNLKIFSATPVMINDKLTGYIYVILAGEEYVSATEMLFRSYIMKVGTYSFFITLVAAFALGLLAIWFITRNLNKIITAVKKFTAGDLKARIIYKSKKGEIAELAKNFNEMADTILSNIEKIKSMENLRSELIANVSHDLRTPLAIIHGFVETLIIKESSLTDEERRKYTNNILQSTEKLKNLVAQLFEYSKLQSMQIKPNKEPFFITELIQDISHKYQIIAKKKGIAIKLTTQNDLPLVNADLALIDRVIQNLIDNAIKFTPEGGSINIELNKNFDKVRVAISDTGAGIPEDELDQIFDRYHKVRRNSSDEIEGSGLGLAIVKKILEIHNSSIKVISKINRGTSFIFELPSYAK
jgi:signal transduction histidine kinase